MIHQLKQSLWVFDIGIRRMNVQLLPGWALHMGAFVALALSLVAAFKLGAPDWPVLVISAIDLFVTVHLVQRIVRRIGRLGTSGPSRARWWFELAALDWTLLVSAGLFWIAHGKFAAALPAWQQLFLAVAAECAEYLYIPFFVFAAIGIFLGLAQRKRLRGNSLELVNFFFWMLLVIHGSLLMIPEHPAVGTWIAATFAVIGLAALFLACVIGVQHRLVKRTSEKLA